METLPSDIIYFVLYKLSWIDILSFINTCQHIYQYVNNDNKNRPVKHNFWKQYFFSYLSLPIQNLYIDTSIDYDFMIKNGKYLITISSLYPHIQYHKYKNILSHWQKEVLPPQPVINYQSSPKPPEIYWQYNSIIQEIDCIRLGYYVYPTANFSGTIIIIRIDYKLEIKNISDGQIINNRVATASLYDIILDTFIKDHIEFVQMEKRHKTVFYLLIR